MIALKSKRELEIMRQAGRIVAEALEQARAAVRPGVTTAELDRVVDEVIRDRGASPSFKGLYGFPAAACVSVNEEVVHGIPGRRILRDGDIVSIDAGAFLSGFHADGAWTFPVGEIAPDVARLLDVTLTALNKGVAQVRPEGWLLDIVTAVQSYVEGQGMSLVRQYHGHGVGRKLHEPPDVPNWLPSGSRPRNTRLKPGMTFTIEPMVAMGGWETYVKPDHWTVVTVDRRHAAHFEHTLAVTETGCEILTLPPK